MGGFVGDVFDFVGDSVDGILSATLVRNSGPTKARLEAQRKQQERLEAERKKAEAEAKRLKEERERKEDARKRRLRGRSSLIAGSELGDESNNKLG